MMFVPHIFGSCLVTCFINFNISKLSARFCSSLMLFRKSITLASLSFVFSSAMGISCKNVALPIKKTGRKGFFLYALFF
jgi:hypothetical protein